MIPLNLGQRSAQEKKLRGGGHVARDVSDMQELRAASSGQPVRRQGLRPQTTRDRVLPRTGISLGVGLPPAPPSRSTGSSAQKPAWLASGTQMSQCVGETSGR